VEILFERVKKVVGIHDISEEQIKKSKELS
jgi:hypothetical protein